MEEGESHYTQSNLGCLFTALKVGAIVLLLIFFSLGLFAGVVIAAMSNLLI